MIALRMIAVNKFIKKRRVDQSATRLFFVEKLSADIYILGES